MALKMQSAATTPTEAADGAKKKNKMMPIIIVIIVLLGAAGGFFGVKAATAKKGAGNGKDVVQVGEVVPLDEFMLNLADPSNEHYIKTTISLGLAEGVSADKFKNKVPQTRDAIIMVLSSEKLDDLRTDSGKDALKKALIDKVNAAVGNPDVAAVYFQDFATQ